MIEYKHAVYFPSLSTAPTMVTVYEQVPGGYATNKGILSGAHLFHSDSLKQAAGLHVEYKQFKSQFEEMYRLLTQASLSELEKQ